MILLKKWTLRIVAGLGLIVVAMLVTAPANLMENQLTTRIPDLQIQGISGGFWSGQFQQIYYQGTSFKQFSWELSLLAMLRGKIGAEISLNDPLFTGGLSFEQGFSDTLQLSKANAHQSVVALASHWLAFRMFRPEGELVWGNVSLALAGKSFEQASGVIQWQNASFNINGEPFSLGTIYLTLNADKGDLLLTISDGQSVLDLQGTLRISGDRKYLLQASLKEDLPATISNAVRLMARPDGHGRLTFTLPGKF